MGCYISTNKSTPPPKTDHIPSSTDNHGGVSKSPSPTHPLAEEETVKEVLSKTPKPPIPISNYHDSPFIKSAPLLKNKPPFIANDHSEASEICSTLSESINNSTSITDRRELAAELRWRTSPARSRSHPFSGELSQRENGGEITRPSFPSLLLRRIRSRNFHREDADPVDLLFLHRIGDGRSAGFGIGRQTQ